MLYAWIASQFMLNLRSIESSNPHQLTGECFDAAELLPVLQQAKSYTTLFIVHLLNAWLCLLFKEYSDAISHSQQAEQYAESVIGITVVVSHNFIYSLALLAAWPMEDESTQAKYLAKVAANQERMALWTHHAPMNYQHKFDLVEAERLRVVGKHWHAVASYERAIQGAREHGYLHDEALAHELAAEFFLVNDMATAGQAHLHAAHAAYMRWQASTKVAALEAHYPQLTPAHAEETQTASDFLSTSNISPSSTSTSLWDASSILKASQTLSSEMNLPQLLIQLMELVIENAGAETGYLLLLRQDRWVIEAEGRVDLADLNVAVMQSIPLDQVDYLSHAIVNYVARTRQPVVLDDASDDGPFQRDRAIKNRQPKSVLCMPLLNQSNLSAILYLENNLISGAFTEDRLEVLTLLGSQAAISLENATLYTQQQQAEVRARYMVQFQQSLIAASNQLLQHPASTSLYQQILQQAVQIIPGAQAGSITQRGDDNRHYFVAAVGYDLTEISKVSFTDDEALEISDKGASSYLVENLRDLNQSNLASSEYFTFW
ncbi:GAF domain-containing protein [Chloroflexi bacterium TSY]|nr:GAF domain-containing protein [Chloroflexi bacterium TSY]